MASQSNGTLALRSSLPSPVIYHNNELVIRRQYLPSINNEVAVAKAEQAFHDKFATIAEPIITPHVFVGTHIELWSKAKEEIDLIEGFGGQKMIEAAQKAALMTSPEALNEVESQDESSLVDNEEAPQQTELEKIDEYLATCIYEYLDYEIGKGDTDIEELRDAIFAPDDQGGIDIDAGAVRRVFITPGFTKWLREAKPSVYTDRIKELPIIPERVNALVHSEANRMKKLVGVANKKMIHWNASQVQALRCGKTGELLTNPVHIHPFHPDNDPVNYGVLFQNEHFTYIMPNGDTLLEIVEGADEITGYEPALDRKLMFANLAYKIVDSFANAIKDANVKKLKQLAKFLKKSLSEWQVKVAEWKKANDGKEIEGLDTLTAIDDMIEGIIQKLQENPSEAKEELEMLYLLYAFEAEKLKKVASDLLADYLNQIHIAYCKSTNTPTPVSSNRGSTLEHISTDPKLITHYTYRLIETYSELVDPRSVEHIQRIPYIKLRFDDTDFKRLDNQNGIVELIEGMENLSIESPPLQTKSVITKSVTTKISRQ